VDGAGPATATGVPAAGPRATASVPADGQEVLSTYAHLFNIPLSYTQEGLRSARFPIEGYDELTVEEISGRVGGLSVEELREVRDHEERTKNRDTVLEQLDRRIRASF
jgi:hypothetical protein